MTATWNKYRGKCTLCSYKRHILTGTTWCGACNTRLKSRTAAQRDDEAVERARQQFGREAREKELVSLLNWRIEYDLSMEFRMTTDEECRKDSEGQLADGAELWRMMVREELGDEYRTRT